MRALTVRQPWASAIVHGSKRVENRTRTCTPQLLAIHAACAGDPADGLPRRAILGVARVYGAVLLSELRRQARTDPRARSELDWALGPWCWRIDRVWCLPEPLPVARGQLGLWRLPDDVLDVLDALVREPGVA